ncbi:Hsp20/alpha crystallin family protein [Lactobacillus sp. ESL0684]|uniref:Hsp20/alpha crystallin family protein n=1 Tax=Lactobacillus sp. ESL0684 TaxID=2983213 RepID=UPI0023F70438|nr:Hsp20/alpha crystallin family protein [Lactobacillus sp. ESL0684]WEV44020.1 Hsp20/alpha crystallin family protein [Lactobacillus sp. ESL0684]
MSNDMMNHRGDIFDAMNDWFDLPRKFWDNNNGRNLMQADVAETKDNYVVKVDLPGMDKSELKLNYQNDTLSIAGTRTFNQETTNQKNLIHRERSMGHISRSFRLPNVEASQIHAKYQDGVLTVTLPKRAASEQDSSINID